MKTKNYGKRQRNAVVKSAKLHSLYLTNTCEIEERQFLHLAKEQRAWNIHFNTVCKRLEKNCFSAIKMSYL